MLNSRWSALCHWRRDVVNIVSPEPAPGLIRRLAAIGYDVLLLFGALFLAALPLPLIPESLQEAWWIRVLTQVYLCLVCFAFFGGFWVHGGQTLGMRAWRLKLVDLDGETISWTRAAWRLCCAVISWIALGFGYIWILFDRYNMAWHDRWSQSRVVLLPKKTQINSEPP